MTIQAADRVKVQWSGTGTGTITLGAAITTDGGFQAFPSALNGQVISYAIKHTTAQEAEAGYGTYTHAGTTLTRTFRTYPAFGGAAVNFSPGTKEVSIAPLSINVAPNIATVSPTATDDITAGYLAGWSRWLNTTTDTLWFCVDHTASAAVWTQVGGGGGAVASVNGQTGTVVLNATHINVVGTATNITPAGAQIEQWLAAIDAEFGSVAVGSDATPATDPNVTGAVYELDPAYQLHTNRDVQSSQASQRFNVPASTPARRRWLIYPKHDGVLVGVTGDVGSVNASAGGTATLINGGVVIVGVDSNAGSAPVVQVRGDVIVPAIDVGGIKTYDNDDHGQDFRLTSTSTQTFGAAAGYGAGFYVNLFKETTGNVTIDGVDADYTMAPTATEPAVVTVMKVGTALIAFGSGATKTLDAA